MRTLTLLAAFLLLAVLAQAQTKLRMGQQGLEQYQPMAKGQDQGRTEDQDMVITLKGEDHHSKGVAGETPADVQLGLAEHYRGCGGDVESRLI